MNFKKPFSNHFNYARLNNDGHNEVSKTHLSQLGHAPALKHQSLPYFHIIFKTLFEHFEIVDKK